MLRYTTLSTSRPMYICEYNLVFSAILLADEVPPVQMGMGQSVNHVRAADY